MTPAMTREQAVEAARTLWGPRADSVKLGKSYFLGVQKSRLEWDWKAHGRSWEEAVEDARRQKAESATTSAALKEKFARVPVRIDGDVIHREWRGVVYEIKVLPDGGFEHLGVRFKSATAVVKSITSARSVNGVAWLGLDQKGGAA